AGVAVFTFNQQRFQINEQGIDRDRSTSRAQESEKVSLTSQGEAARAGRPACGFALAWRLASAKPQALTELVPKLCLGTHFPEAPLPRSSGQAKQSFSKVRPQAGAWERGFLTMPHPSRKHDLPACYAMVHPGLEAVAAEEI